MQTKASLDIVSGAAGGRWSDIAELAGRILLAVIFLLSGLGKITSYRATAAFMASMGVPGALIPVVIATEVLGGLGIVLGWKTRIVAFLLAGFTLLTAVLFHSSFGDQEQMINFLKNLSMTGGFLLLVVHGPGSLSIDRYFAKE
jgi:putative oxidoreductase